MWSWTRHLTSVEFNRLLALCLSFITNGVKKEEIAGFYKTKTTEDKALYYLITKAISDLALNLTNIVGKCFHGAANMSGKEKELSVQMKDCSPFAVYVYYVYILRTSA